MTRKTFDYKKHLYCDVTFTKDETEKVIDFSGSDVYENMKKEFNGFYSETVFTDFNSNGGNNTITIFDVMSGETNYGLTVFVGGSGYKNIKFSSVFHCGSAWQASQMGRFYACVPAFDTPRKGVSFYSQRGSYWVSISNQVRIAMSSITSGSVNFKLYYF